MSNIYDENFFLVFYYEIIDMLRKKKNKGPIDCLSINLLKCKPSSMSHWAL